MDQCVAAPTSIYSIKRTSAETVLPNSMRSASSSSLTPLLLVGMGNSVMAPAGVIMPTLLPKYSTNQMLPPVSVILVGTLAYVGMGNSVTAPLGVIRPTLPDCSTNQRLPSG